MCDINIITTLVNSVATTGLAKRIRTLFREHVFTNNFNSAENGK